MSTEKAAILVIWSQAVYNIWIDELSLLQNKWRPAKKWRSVFRTKSNWLHAIWRHRRREVGRGIVTCHGGLLSNFYYISMDTNIFLYRSP